MDHQLIDRIYECAFAPDLWPDVLGGLADRADARGGVLLATDLARRNILNWTTSQSMRSIMDKFVSDGLFARQQRLAKFMNRRNGGFLTERQVYSSEDEMRSDPLYHELLWPAGLGWCAATTEPLPTGDLIIFTFEVDFDRGPPDTTAIQGLNAFRPHLARSAFMSARMQLERARAASEALALIGLPALVFDGRGKVLAANDLIEALTAHIRWRAQDRISLLDAAADKLFQRAIETLDNESGASTRSFAVRGADNAASMVAHIIPVRRSARDILVRCAGLLALTPVTLPQAPPVELVQSLFDLTPAEARVARSLTAGETLNEIAAQGGVSLNTIRTQLRGVLEKTGCNRQAEVVALLGGLAARAG